MSFSFLTRNEWGAAKPLKWKDLATPVVRVYNMATGGRKCYEELHCVQNCQQMQLQHMKRKYGDINFSFMVGGDGQVYEGRGWRYAPRLPKEYMGFNPHKCISIGFIGRWYDSDVDPIMIRAASDLIDLGIKNNFITKDYRPIDLFHNTFREQVVAEIIKESRLNRAKRRLKNDKFREAMGLTNEILDET